MLLPAAYLRIWSCQIRTPSIAQSCGNSGFRACIFLRNVLYCRSKSIQSDSLEKLFTDLHFYVLGRERFFFEEDHHAYFYASSGCPDSTGR